MSPVKPRKGNNMAEQEEIDRGDFVEDLEGEEVEDASEELEEELEEGLEGDETAEEEELEDTDEVSEEDDEELEDTDEDEEASDEEEDEADGNARIPRSRLNQVIQQREEEKARSAWLEEQLETLIKQRQEPEPEKVADEPVSTYDFDEAEEKYIELILEGSVKEARQVRKEINVEHETIREHQMAVAQKQATENAQVAASSSVEESKFQDFVEDTFSDKSYLDDTSDDYNERAVKMANSLMSSYVADGMDRISALDQAVKDITPLFEEDASPKPVLGKKKASARTKTARKKALKASEQQPQTTERKSSGKGARDLDALDVGKMTDRAFNSLTAKEKAVLRGD